MKDNKQSLAESTFGHLPHFTASVFAILLLTALAKLFSLRGDSAILSAEDPLTNLNYKTLFLLAGIIEITVCTLLLLIKNLRSQLFLILWVGANFLLYRIGTYVLGGTPHCPCLGSMTEALHIRPAAADKGLLLVAFYMTLGSLFFLFKSRSPAPDSPRLAR